MVYSWMASSSSLPNSFVRKLIHASLVRGGDAQRESE